MTVVIKTICNGCGMDLSGRVVAQLTRINGLGGGGLPEPEQPWDLCLDCAQAGARAILARNTALTATNGRA